MALIQFNTLAHCSDVQLFLQECVFLCIDLVRRPLIEKKFLYLLFTHIYSFI